MTAAKTIYGPLNTNNNPFFYYCYFVCTHDPQSYAILTVFSIKFPM